jgi:hypothetical protein
MKRTDSSPNLLVNLAFDKRMYKASEAQKLVFSLTNESDKPITVLKWDTPLEGFKSNMFHVEYAGKQAVYLGRVYKRGVPTEDDYITIHPGKTVKQAVDFTEAYDIAEAAHYSVKYKTALLHAGIEEPKLLMKRYMMPRPVAAVAVRGNTAVFKLQENRKAKTLNGVEIAWMKMKGPGPAKKTPSFNGCSLSQQGTITKALAQAVKFAAEARSALSGAPGWARPTAPRYKEWFGTYDSTRYSTVNTHYDKIWDALANQNVTFDCSHTDNAYAYVYPTKPYIIYLCKLFWPAPLAGTDSQGGTIVHETSHFNVVASTDDHVYGQAGARNLAKTKPDDAIDNADSHEYFAENTPALTMDAVPGSIFKITDGWKSMPAGFSGGFDAVLNGGGPFVGKCYFFKGDKYVRYDWVKDRADTGYPKKIADNWHSLPPGFTGNFDDAVNGQGPFVGKCYFFKGDSYVRYDWGSDKADAGYPKKIAANWNNLPAGFKDNFDAIINGGGPFAGKCYFFKGDSYIRYDWQTDRADTGYPKKIADNWHCLPTGYTGTFDAALEGDKQFSGRGYFFKGNFYIRYNWQGDYAEV